MIKTLTRDKVFNEDLSEKRPLLKTLIKSSLKFTKKRQFRNCDFLILRHILTTSTYWVDGVNVAQEMERN